LSYHPALAGRAERKDPTPTIGGPSRRHGAHSARRTGDLDVFHHLRWTVPTSFPEQVDEEDGTGPTSIEPLGP
jgi:hypothetical protein